MDFSRAYNSFGRQKLFLATGCIFWNFFFWKTWNWKFWHRGKLGFLCASESWQKYIGGSTRPVELAPGGFPAMW